MSKVDISRLNLETSGAPVSAVPPAHSRGSAPSPEQSEEDRSKDVFFAQVGAIAEAMVARHGNDFAIGTLVLAAKFIAEGRPLVGRAAGTAGAAASAAPV
ncbi:hypothetical protein ACQR16_12135 [Bradyrhizobium oligotrophicum]|uniref:hypothetical protein n=1 Tax=Bradyrhizobium oligotrophicum TaxID=44255 RepID=UPI003EBCB38B